MWPLAFITLCNLFGMDSADFRKYSAYIELRTLRTQKFIQHNTCVYVCNNVTVFKHFMCIKYIKIPVKIPTSHVIPRNEKGHNISYKHLYK